MGVKGACVHSREGGRDRKEEEKEVKMSLKPKKRQEQQHRDGAG